MEFFNSDGTDSISLHKLTTCAKNLPSKDLDALIFVAEQLLEAHGLHLNNDNNQVE